MVGTVRWSEMATEDLGGKRRAIAAAVVIPAGPRDDVMDTIDSVLTHATVPQVVVIVDDTKGQQNLTGIRSMRDVHVIPAPSARAGTTGGLWLKVCTGYRWLLERYAPTVVLRLDADALILGPGLLDHAMEAIRADPGIGLLGACRFG